MNSVNISNFESFKICFAYFSLKKQKSKMKEAKNRKSMIERKKVKKEKVKRFI